MTHCLICPHDKATLQAYAGYYHCPDCQRRYPLIDGVVCTLDKPDAFYEGAYGNQTHFLPRSEKPWHVWPLWLINSGYVWAVREAVSACSTCKFYIWMGFMRLVDTLICPWLPERWARIDRVVATK